MVSKIMSVVDYNERSKELTYVELTIGENNRLSKLLTPKTMSLNGVNTETPGRKITTSLFKKNTLYFVTIGDDLIMNVHYDCTIFNLSHDNRSLVWNIKKPKSLHNKDVTKLNVSQSKVVYDILKNVKLNHKPNTLTKFIMQSFCYFYGKPYLYDESDIEFLKETKNQSKPIVSEMVDKYPELLTIDSDSKFKRASDWEINFIKEYSHLSSKKTW
jgi:hypothetical protein